MKKTNKENPLTTFRKANEARQKIVKSSMTKMQKGGGITIDKISISPNDPYEKEMKLNKLKMIKLGNEKQLKKAKEMFKTAKNKNDYTAAKKTATNLKSYK
jgi:hypothetical protein